MSRSPRVLIVAQSSDRIGGQQIQAAGMVAHLGGNGAAEVSFLPIGSRLPGPLGRFQRVKYLRTLVNSIVYGARLLTRVPRQDVVHVFSAAHSSFVISTTPAILAARLFQRRTILNYHSGEGEDHLARRGRSAIPIMRMADAIVVPSETMARLFTSNGLPARMLPNAIELDRFRFRARPSLRPVFLSSRSLFPHYNVECVIRAFALIQQRVSEARLIVAGDGPERRRLEGLTRELGLRHVRFVGWVPQVDMGELYESADIYLNGSDVDSAPLTILEANAAGLPVVTTDAGGIPDIVEDGITGMVVRRGDHVAMAESADRLLADPQLAGKLIEAARRRSLDFGWDSARARWGALYRELADGRVDA